ncbi:tetratricopeptide repeat protein [Prevotella sp. PTAC]|uniref:tetratricopeptide repeat protein n=1 Tax=Prevotella sp. PTAC TaxID=2736295 RepID=UPI001554DECB|nr:tetratricopeptide repeat protein [Prevotella sp. PTAC]NPD54747.1 tetratricopeptide repeat protein [Prevotella sp. PTAC]
MDDIVLPKWIVCYVLAGIALVFVSITLINASHYACLSCKSIVFCIGLLAISLSMYGDRYFQCVFIKTVFFLSVFLLFRTYRDSKKIVESLKNALIAGSLYSLFVIFCFRQSTNVLMAGTYDNSAGLAFTLSVTAVFLFQDCKRNKNSFYFILKMMIVTMLIITIFISGSRTGVIAVCVSGVVILCSRHRYIISVVCFFIVLTLMLFKPASTSGRALIYTVSVSMLDSGKNILFGRGSGGFRRSYMTYQARHLRCETENKKMLADNVKHPLNEILFFMVNYGLIRFCFLAVLLYMCFRSIYSGTFVIGLSAVIIIFTIFSYPFSYPLTWIVTAYALANITDNIPIKNMESLKPMSLVMFIAGIGIISYSFLYAKWQKEWENAYEDVWIAQYPSALQEYERLSKSVFVNPEFHYNYAAGLLQAGRSRQALVELDKCDIIDYDSMLLRGEIYAEEKNYDKALACFRQAAAMCPNRFVPLFAIYQIYEKTNDVKAKENIANKILTKQIKIPSVRINDIINYIKQTR